MSDKTPRQLMLELAAPFGPDEIKAKPAVVSGNRALALFYIDARLVMDRLDDVLGIGNWQAKYRAASEGVVCSLSVRIAGEWIVHEDFGGFSEQPDEGDKFKAAFSDALKRAAVHLGIGRYLYRLPQLWADYDPQKRTFKTKPAIPTAALSHAVHTPPAEQPTQQPEKPAAQQPTEQKTGQKLPEARKAAVARLLQLAPAVASRLKTTAPAVTEAVLAQLKAQALDALDKPQVVALRELCAALEAGKPPVEVIPALGKGKRVQTASAEQLARLEELRRDCALGESAVKDGLRQVGAAAIGDLTEQQAGRLIALWEAVEERLAREADFEVAR